FCLDFKKFGMIYNNFNDKLDSVDIVLTPYFNEEVYEEEIEEDTMEEESISDVIISELLFEEESFKDLLVTKQQNIIDNYNLIIEVLFDLFDFVSEYTIEELVTNDIIFYLNHDKKFWNKEI